ncbi:MAG: HAD family hydrolase [Planctomycetes bacterium]|nr:HAD family hydrolase [Planctomycetota bacterium]
MTMITTVVFDLDDTLYDEVEYCRSGLASVSEFLANLPEMPPADRLFGAFWKQFTAGNHTRTFNSTLDELGIGYDDKFIRQLIKVYRNHVPKIILPRESREVLSELSPKFTLALLTDGFLPSQQLKVQALGIEKYFKCIIYTEQLGREFWKPSPAGFEKLIDTLNAKPNTMVYVADNLVKDFIAPNRLGFTTIQIIRSARLHIESSQEPDSAAKYTIRQISLLPPLLDKF